MNNGNGTILDHTSPQTVISMKPATISYLQNDNIWYKEQQAMTKKKEENQWQKQLAHK